MSALAPRPQYPSFKFDHLGATIRGVIVAPPEDRPAKDFTTGKPKVWPDGNPVIQTKIVLQLPDGNRYAIYAEGRMARAITSAIVQAQAADLEVGGTLEVEHHQLGDAKNGGQPPKLYRAGYVPPEAGSHDDDEPPF